MRITSEIKKLGYFWISSIPEKKVPGTLTISDGGRIELEVVGLFDESPTALARYFGPRHELIRLNGLVEEYGPVTLEECFFKTQNISLGGGVAKSQAHVSRAFIGASFENGEEILLNRFRFSVEGLDEWFGLSGIGVENDFSNKSATITYSPLDEVALNLDNKMVLKITFSWSLPGFPNIVEAKISQKTYFELLSIDKLRLSEFVSIAHKITTFLSLAVDKAVCVDHAIAESEDLLLGVSEGKSVPVPIKVYYEDLSYTRDIPTINAHDMLFQYAQIIDNAEAVMNSWLRAYDIVDPSLRLYFSVKTGAQKYLEGRFLALAQGIETFHRRQFSEKLMNEVEFDDLIDKICSQCPGDKKEWLLGRLRHGNELSFSRRLSRIIEPIKKYFGEKKQRCKLIRNIVDTRNYLTHYDISLEAVALKGVDLHRACLQLEAMFQLHFLLLLGFDQSGIENVIQNSAELRYKLRML